MSRMQGSNVRSDLQAHFTRTSGGGSLLDVGAWIPSEINAISPLVERLMRLIEGSHCITGEEYEVELALREALSNAVVHGDQDPEKKVHIRCRCAPGAGISIVVTDQGKGFDFGKLASNGLTPDSAAAHGHGIQLMQAYMDDVHFARGGSQVHMRKRSRTTPCSSRGKETS